MASQINSGMCRCCASEGTFKDVKTTYHWMGDAEVYSDMLRECFDISLCTDADGEVDGGICEVCITQLRNAANFKKQVQQTEEEFKRRLEDKLFKNEIVKVEVPQELEEEHLDSDNDNNLSDDFSEYEVPIKEEKEDKPKKRAAAKASTSRVTRKKAKVEDGETSKQVTTCITCNHDYRTTFNLKRHLRIEHGVDSIITRKKLCEDCGKVLFNDDYLAKHRAKGCPNMKTNICIKCSMKFQSNSDMYKHMRLLHWTEQKLLKLRCHLCEMVCKSHVEHDKHLASVHEVMLEYEDLTFESMEDLIHWKDEEETSQNVCYLKRSSNNGDYFHCYPIKYLGASRLLRRTICPARIEVRETSAAILVSYQSTHVCDRHNQKNIKQMFCPICSIRLNNYNELNDHLSSHGIEVVVENQSFSCFEGTEGTKRKKKKKGDESATPERVEHRVNLTAILQYSNASPFRDKTMRGFSCLYCAQHFPHIDELREHTAQQSEKDKLNSMIDYKLSYNPIKVDITNLRCKVCDAEMKDLNDLKDHLIQFHNKTIYKNIKDIILPFRLENGTNFTCVLCSVVHISFKNLYHHMSSHYRNYCCKKCGAGYITIAALRKHGKTHFQGHFPCDYCEKSYTSLTKKRNHEKGVHTGGWLRNKCPHCPEIFVSYYDRSEHLVKVHNETPVLYPCNACNKVYKKKFELNRHIKHHHLQQKSFLCDKCNAKFFSKRGLTDHLSRHAGGEMCSCEVCGKTFSRYRSLKEHQKIHDEDKRYQCEICKKTFMQKCSLKSHVRLHQDDLDIFKEFDDVKHLIDNRDMTLKEIAEENKKKEQDDKMKGIFT